MTRPGARRSAANRGRSAMLSGAGSLSVTGTGRVNKLVNAVLRDDPFAHDAGNLHGDFERAMSSERARKKR